jgi:hypothetical protein
VATSFFAGNFFSGEFFNAGVAPATIYYQGDGKRKRKRRRKTYDLFNELERTLRATLAGEVEAPEVHAVAAPVLDLSQGYGPALDQLLATAGEYEELSQRVTRLRADVATVERQRKQEWLQADDEEWLLWL